MTYNKKIYVLLHSGTEFWKFLEFLNDENRNCLCITKTSYFKLINHVNGLLLESPWGFSRGTNQVIKFWNFHHSLTISGEGRGNIWINHSKGKWWTQSCLGNVDFTRKSKRIRFGELQVDEPEWIHVLGEW